MISYVPSTSSAASYQPEMNRLSLDSLSEVPARNRPAYDPRSVRVGILHMGIGSFHRAHQAVYTDEAIALGDDTWGICGVTQRSAAVQDLLAPQDNLYSVLEREHTTESIAVPSPRGSVLLLRAGCAS